MPERNVFIGPFQFDRSGLALTRDGRPVDIGQRGIALLKALHEARGEVVTKAELMERVWPDVTVEEGNLTVQVAALRKALGPRPDGDDWITTVPRVGYRFAAIDGAEPGAVVELPSLAVLPFLNLSGDAGEEYFVDGIVEELITALSRFKTFAVVARNSSFAYKGRAVDVRQVARELNVRYVLEGSVRRTADRVRVTTQLADGESGAQRWADKFDGRLEDVFAFQDSVTASVVGLVEPQIRRAEIERTRRKRPESLTGYDLYLQVLPMMQSGTGRSKTGNEYDAAVDLIRRAVELDRQFAPGLAYAAWAHERRHTRGGTPPLGIDDVSEALGFAERALMADDTDAIVLALSGVSLVTVGNDAPRGLALLRRARVLNPNAQLVCFIAGYGLFHCGYLDEAIACFEHGRRLSPVMPDILWSCNGLSRIHLSAGRFEEALHWARTSMSHSTEHNFTHCLLGAALAQLGRLDEAREAIRTGLAIWPDLSIDGLLARVGDKEGRDRLFVEGMRMAGLPER